jgi:3-oxoadipate enol-lactonase
VSTDAGAARTRGEGAERDVDRPTDSPDPATRATGRDTVTAATDRDLAVDDGGDGPAVVLLHGLAGAKELWNETLAALRAAGFRAIAYDQRGHGRSPDVTPPWTIGDLADDLRRVLDQRGVRRAAIVGHSMGGRAMFSFALSSPERTWALVAVGAHSEAPRPPYDRVLLRIREAAVRDGLSGFLRAFADAGEVPDRVASDPRYAAEFDTWFGRNRPGMLLAALDAIVAMPALTPRLGEIREPMLSVVGELDVHFRELADHYARAMQRCRTIVIPGVRHYPMTDAQQPFARALVDFLEEVRPAESAVLPLDG